MPTVIFPTAVPLRMPLARKLSMPTRVIEFLDGSEQRWAAGDPLNAFTVTFADVPAAELAAVQSWWNTIKGAFDATWSFVDADGTTYPHMAAEGDELAGVESARAMPGIAQAIVTARIAHGKARNVQRGRTPLSDD